MTDAAATAGTIQLRYALEREAFKLDIDAEFSMRGITGIFGRSGAGKTSLLRCIAGLEKPTRGRLVVDNDIWEDTGQDVCRTVHERDIGYVFQEPRLFPHLDVRRNLDYGRKRAATRAEPSFDEVVELLGLGTLLERRPERLSGGEAQRVAIGRALLRSPSFVLMDEPVAALDAARREEVLPFIDALHANLSMPVLYVSHNVEEICLLCDQLLVLDSGHALAHGELQDVLMRTDLPVLAGDEAGSVIVAECVSFDDTYGLSEVAVSAGRLRVPGRHKPSAKLRLRLRANDISLTRERPTQSSILNYLPATIERLQDETEYSVLVQARAGDDRLLSRITRLSAAELTLSPGDEVILQIKSVSVRSASA